VRLAACLMRKAGGESSSLADDLKTKLRVAPKQLAILKDKVTMIMATSPVKSNPSTKLLHHTMKSIRVYCQGTEDIRKIIVCDGYSTLDESHTKGVARRGRRITDDKAKDYKEYLSRIKKLIEEKDRDFANAEMLILPKLHGFGLAMKEALKLVETPYVYVTQHDRAFDRKATPLRDLVKLLDNEEKVNYVGYLTERQLNYANRMISQHNLKIPPEKLQGLHVIPLIHFLDSMHLARKSLWQYMFDTGTIRVRQIPRAEGGKMFKRLLFILPR